MNDMEAIEILKTLLGIKDNEQDSLLSFLISDTENLIKGYCRIDIVPRQLESLVPVIAADIYRTKGYGQQGVPTVVTSETQGSRSWSYENKAVNTDNVLLGYEQRLNPFMNRKGHVPSDLCK